MKTHLLCCFIEHVNEEHLTHVQEAQATTKYILRKKSYLGNKRSNPRLQELQLTVKKKKKLNSFIKSIKEESDGNFCHTETT